MRNRPTLATLAFSLASAAVGGEWRTVAVPLALAFPADHGAHPAYRTEWWYVTGLLVDPAGRRYGYQLTFFRQGLRAAPAEAGESELLPRHVLAAHLAVADVAGGHFSHAQRLRRAAVDLAGFATGDLAVWVEDWEMRRGEGDVLTLTAADREVGLGLHLRLQPTRPLVRHGDGGVSRKGDEPGNASAYLSWTRLATSGTLTVAGRQVPVSGTSWLDHEWGSTQLGPDVAGWDWLGLRLEDGRDLMVYRLRRVDGSASPHSGGTLIAPDGTPLPLRAEQLHLEPLTQWKSPRSGATYPAQLRLRVPSAGLELTVTPLLADTELDTRASTGVIYWEGPVRVSGSAAGEGYMELTGYAGSLQGRF